jgi:hypothetical protein
VGSLSVPIGTLLFGDSRPRITFQQALASFSRLAALGDRDPDLENRCRRSPIAAGRLQRRYLLNQSNVLCQASFAADSS